MDGQLKVHCHDAATWKFPSFAGQVACRGLDFHFWDAVDDLSKTDIDLVFDDQRLYMHNATGMFGSVPLTLSGESLSFRLDAHCKQAAQYQHGHFPKRVGIIDPGRVLCQWLCNQQPQNVCWSWLAAEFE